MRHVALLLLTCVATFAAAQQPRTSRCWTACERNVDDPRVRASACTACLTHPEDSAAWLARAPTPLTRLLNDDDWQVRWAGIEDASSKTKTEVSRSLAEWIGRAKDAELNRACITALHGAAKTKQTLDALLAKEKPARESCRKHEKELVALLQVELYDERLPVRREALLHGAMALGLSPARLVLDSVPAHPASFDTLVLETLEEVASTEPFTGPAQLLAAAKQEDVAVMNRLLAVYGAQRDDARVRLETKTDATERKEAINTLARLAPLSDSELLKALDDKDPAIRRGGAHGLGRGLGGTIATAAEKFVLQTSPASLSQQSALIKFMGDANDSNCAEVAMRIWNTGALDSTLRRRALPVAASCEWAAARETVESILRSEAKGMPLAAAVASLASAPRNDQLLERLEQAVRNVDGAVRAAGCEAIAAHRWRNGISRVMPLLRDPEAPVRAAAIDALMLLDAPNLDTPLAHLLEGDPSAEVRVAAARVLGTLGGPRALATLTAASRNDTDSNVKLVAAESLRKLGSGSRPP
ncbi:MAG: HEAT repeat domain-containing protein [Archangium sp.]